MNAISLVGFFLAIFLGWDKIKGAWMRISKPIKLNGYWTSFHLYKSETGKNLLRKGEWIFHRTTFNLAKVKLTFNEISEEEYEGDVTYFSSANIFSESFKEFASIRLRSKELFSIMLFGIFKDTVHGIWFGPENNQILTADYFILTSKTLSDGEAEERIIEGRKKCLPGSFAMNQVQE